MQLIIKLLVMEVLDIIET